jgi:hypothetical protein
MGSKVFGVHTELRHGICLRLFHLLKKAIKRLTESLFYTTIRFGKKKLGTVYDHGGVNDDFFTSVCRHG